MLLGFAAALPRARNLLVDVLPPPRRLGVEMLEQRRVLATVSAAFTADNHYGLYVGNEDGSQLTLVGRNESGPAGSQGAYNWSYPETFQFDAPAGSHLFLVAWDSGLWQMAAGQFTVDGGQTIGTNAEAWEVMTSTHANPGDTGPLPDSGTLTAEIQAGSFQAPQAVAPPGTSPWGRIPGLSDSAQFIWPDTFAHTSASDGNYVIFRTTEPIDGPQDPPASAGATLTADNHYGLFVGSGDGERLSFIGRNETGLAGNPGKYNWNLPETWNFTPQVDDHIYVVAWDVGGPQSWIGQFTLPDGSTLVSNSQDWEYVIGAGPNPGTLGAVPPAQELRTRIAAAGWQAIGAQAANGAGPWGSIPGISPTANFIWHDKFADGSASDAGYAIYRTKAPIGLPPDTGGDTPPCGCTTTCALTPDGGLSGGTGSTFGGGAGLSPGMTLERHQSSFERPSTADSADSSFGNGWTRSAAPWVTMYGSNPNDPAAMVVTFSGSDFRVFRNRSSTLGAPEYTRASRVGSTDSLTLVGSQVIYRMSTGDTLTFNSFDASIPEAARGKLVSQTDSAGNQLVYTFNPDGTVTKLESFLAGEATPVEIQEYFYVGSGDPNAGKVASIDIRRGDSTLVRTTLFTYHDGSSSFGALGDLASLTTLDASSEILDASAYRYVAGTSGSLLQYVLDTDSVRRATAAGVVVATASNAAIAPYATSFYEYDARDRVIRRDVQGAGCSSCAGGIGTYAYAYHLNPNPDPTANPNSSWRIRTTETMPDGTEKVTYSNALDRPMLEVTRTFDNGSSTPKQFGTYTRYNAGGLVIWRASAEALALPADLSELEQYPGLMKSVGGNFEYVNDTQGLIEVTNYFSSTTATATTPGGVRWFVSSTAVMQGEFGTQVPQSAYTYVVQAAGGNRVTHVATHTTYPNTTTAGAQTTTYAYSYAPGTTQLVSQTTTLPVVSTPQNGSGVADTSQQVFDASGRVIWSKDADGFLRFTEYDEQTGSVTKTIVDVDTTQVASFENLPTGWATPSGGGLHIVSTYEVDELGRTTKSTDPNGSITYTVYDDVNHSVRTYAGWNSVTGKPTGPTQVSRRDLSGTYTESLTFSGAPDLDVNGRPTGTEAITNIESLSRSIMNAAGQVVASDHYFVIPAYSTATATLGNAGVNYLRTTYAYNNQGQVDRIQNPAGTITLHRYNGRGQQIATYVGTDDSTTDGFKWSPSNASPASNMVLVETHEYDNGGVGNGNRTSTTQYPGGSAEPRTTEYAFDWRNRLVITKTGATANPGTEDTSVNRPLTYVDYDNLGRAIAQSVYDSDGVSILDVNADGVPDKPSAALLRSSQTSAFDARGRTYRTEVLSVDQSTGAIGTAKLTTDTFYDRRGNVAMVMAPNGPVTQSLYDGAGRTTTSLTLGNIPDATWAAATSLADSVVLEQVDFEYDPSGNTILATVRQRFHDASTTDTGLLGTPTSGIPARVSYVASYYDVGNRLTDSVNVGTNGGVSYVRPATVPARSDTVLVTSYVYDDAGRVQDVTDPRGIVTRSLYDLLGRTTASILNYTGGAPGAQTDVTTTFQFDSSGRLASRTAVQPAGTPSQVTGYVYGVSPATGSAITSNDFMVETRYPDRVTGLPSVSDRDVYTTNALGQRTSFTDRAGTTHGYLYDVLGRQTADVITVLGAGIDGSIRRVEMAYDTLGRVQLATTFDAAIGGAVTSQVARAFNGFGQTGTEWQSHTGVVDTFTTPKVQYTYSEGVGGNHSRLTSTVYPDGYVVNVTYSGLDANVSRPTSLTGQRADSFTVATLEAFKHLGIGTVIERLRPEVNINFSLLGATGDAGDQYAGLDRFGRVVAHNWFDGATTTIVDGYGYTYDGNGNRLTRSNVLNSAFSETYTNDALNQLESYVRGDSGSPTKTQDWQFDALGNWTTVTTDGVAEAREANAQNELTDVGGAALAYSATGNLTTDAQGRTLAYDAWNRLVAVYDASSTLVARYEYDGMNRRIVDRVGSPTAPTRDLYYSLGWQLLEERVRDSGGAIPATASSRYVWSPVYVDAMIARDQDADSNPATGTGGLEQRVYALQDANWNTTAIIAATGVPDHTTGDIINRFAYTPYGEVDTLDASWATAASPLVVLWSHLFQGLKFDDATGLAYVRNRDYSARLGRFIERDPIGFRAGDNNWYRFVGNAPVQGLDPSGNVKVEYKPGRLKLVDAKVKPHNWPEHALSSLFDVAWDVDNAAFEKDGCKLCDEIGIIQVIEGSATQSGVGLFMPALWATLNYAWKVDAEDGTPPYGEASSVLGGVVRGDPTGIERISAEDIPHLDPRAPAFYAQSFSKYSMKAETYVVCLSGKEGPDINSMSGPDWSTRTINSITVYAGVTWEHSFAQKADGTWRTLSQKVTSRDAIPAENFKRAIERFYDVSVAPTPPL